LRLLMADAGTDGSLNNLLTSIAPRVVTTKDEFVHVG